MAAELRQRAGGLDPGRATADDRDGEACAAVGTVRQGRRAFELIEDVVAQIARVLDVVEMKRVLADAGDTEVGGGAAGRDDEVVVGDMLAVVGDEHARRRVPARDAGEAELDVGKVPQEASRRVDDGLWLEARGGDLVEERQERVIVAPVEPEHVLPRACEDAHGAKAGESRAEDHDARMRLRHDHRVLPSR